MEWQPIKTAPRDGTWILICNANEGAESFEAGCYDPIIWNTYEEVGDGLFRRVATVRYEWRRFNDFHSATHWMLLPAPPQIEQ